MTVASDIVLGIASGFFFAATCGYIAWWSHPTASLADQTKKGTIEGQWHGALAIGLFCTFLGVVWRVW